MLVVVVVVRRTKDLSRSKVPARISTVQRTHMMLKAGRLLMTRHLSDASKGSHVQCWDQS